MTIAEKIRTQRKRIGFSQERLGEELGVSRQAVTKWENGTAMPESDKITLLGKCFGVSTDYLLKEDMDVPEEVIAHVVLPQKKKRWLKIIGFSMFACFAAFFLILWFLSVCYPVSFMDWDGGHITGFWGFIEIHDLWYQSCVVLIIGITGLVLIGADLVLKKFRAKKKNENM